MLPVDDVRRLGPARLFTPLMNHDRAQEVSGLMLLRLTTQTVGFDLQRGHSYVAPEGRPVLFLVPHIGSLEKWGHIDVVVGEYPAQLDVARVHFSSLPVERPSNTQP